jgi:serine/threonine-protein kinase
MPVPPGGALEGEQGYECTSNGDCHLIVADWSRMQLFEMWRANISGGVFQGGCLAVWDMNRLYPASGRGEQCTSADAAGYPIAPLLFTADEVAAGRIDHAIRFILPNDRIRAAFYVHPATHVGGPAGAPDAPPYGARLRLRADYPVATLPPGARVVARAMQQYGILLADGGQITLTAQSDRYTRAKWSGLLGTRDLSALRPSDFEMIEAGPRIRATNDCVRNP